MTMFIGGMSFGFFALSLATSVVYHKIPDHPRADKNEWMAIVYLAIAAYCFK